MSSQITPACVLERDNPDYETARLAWNLAAYSQPQAVALPSTADEVVAAVEYARAEGLRVAPQATGHGANVLAAGDGVLLLKLANMRGVEIDPEAQIARVEGGAQWADVTTAAAEHGLAALAGSSHDVGVGGYITGGGFSWLARKYGFACHNVRAIDIVTADGSLLRASADENTDLFWAVRGGGGNFGVITAFELQLFPIAEVYAGMLLFPIERDREVLKTWTAWMADQPDEVTSCGRLLHLPPIPDIPEPFRGREFVGVELILLMDEAAAAEAIAPLRGLGPEMDSVGMIPAAALDKLHMDPPEPVPGIGNGALLRSLDDTLIDAVCDHAGADSGSPLLSVELRSMGGALAVEPEGCGAMGARDAAGVMFAVGIAPPPAVAAMTEASNALVEAVDPWRSDRDMLGFRESTTTPERLYGPSLPRLREIKAQVDPDNLFAGNHPL